VLRGHVIFRCDEVDQTSPGDSACVYRMEVRMKLLLGRVGGPLYSRFWKLQILFEFQKGLSNPSNSIATSSSSPVLEFKTQSRRLRCQVSQDESRFDVQNPFLWGCIPALIVLSRLSWVLPCI
jgi:hypothetical protein